MSSISINNQSWKDKMDKAKIYEPNWTVFYYRYWSGVAIFIFVYFLVCIVTPLTEVFTEGFASGINKFIEFNKGFFSYKSYTNIYSFGFLAFCTLLQIISYLSGSDLTRRVYLYKDYLETILFNKKSTKVYYLDIVKTSCNYYDIQLHLKNREIVFIPNNIKNSRQLYDKISEEVIKRGGKAIERDESKRD
jgi:hypothetical protein